MAPGKVLRTLFLAAWLLPLASRAGQPTPATINVGIFTVAPFIVANNGEAPHGVLVDFFDREIAPRMGVKFNWLPPVTVARLEQNLIRGSVTFTPILASTPERTTSKIQFVRDQYIRFDPCIAVLPEYRLAAIKSPADLAGMHIGWVQSGALPNFLSGSDAKFDLISSVDWERVNLEKLKLGRIDGAYFSDQFTPRYYAFQYGVQVRLLKLPTPGVNLFGAFSPDAPPALVASYRRAAKAAFAEGRWDYYMAKALAGK
jgi:polar amino acid transport system substrate-binding protein